MLLKKLDHGMMGSVNKMSFMYPTNDEQFEDFLEKERIKYSEEASCSLLSYCLDGFWLLEDHHKCFGYTKPTQEEYYAWCSVERREFGFPNHEDCNKELEKKYFDMLYVSPKFSMK
jgi:hypothetical protein